MIRRDRISLALSALAIGVAIAAVGGATRWAQAAVALVTAASVASVVSSRRGLERWPPLVALLVVAAAWTTIQLIPLPGGIVQSISPTLDALRDDGAALAGVSVASTLSMDPPATLRALTFLITLSGVAVVALRLSVSERGRYWLMAAVAGFAGFAALVTGLHKLFAATSLYGLYEPHQAGGPVMGPLLNTNHLGCLMAVGTVTSVGLLLYPRQAPMWRAPWAMIAAGCVAVTTATLSRGAMMAVASGLIVTLVTIVAQRAQPADRESRGRREKLFTTTVPVGIVVACLVVTTVYLGAGTVMQQLENTSLDEIHEPKSKFAAWRSSVDLLEESPWVGVGRGAFESTFTRVHPASAFATFSHPENEAVQAVVEWGIPAAIGLGALFIWLVLIALRRWKDGPLAAGALGVLTAVAFQSNFDFGIELLGLAVPVTIITATLTYVPLKELPPRRLRAVRLVRLALVLLITSAAAVLLVDVTRTVDEDHLVLQADPSRSVANASIANHPLDYFGYSVLAEQMIRANDPDAIRLLNHALRLHPTHPGLHRIAARLLVRSGRLSQAESEYSTTVRYSGDPRPVIEEITKVLDPDRAVRAIPLELEIDKAVRALADAQRIDIALRWTDRALTYKPSLRAAETLYSLAMTQKDLAAAERAARVRCAIIPGTPCQMALARVLSSAKKPKQLIAVLHDVAAWHGRRDDQLAAWLMLCDAQAELGPVNDAKDCLRRLEASGLVAPGSSVIQRRRDALAAPRRE